MASATPCSPAARPTYWLARFVVLRLPGAPRRLRLDWQLWFAAMSTPAPYSSWTVHRAARLLPDDPGALSPLAGNPFAGPPRCVRAVRYPLPGQASCRVAGSGASAGVPLAADTPRLLAVLP